MGNEVFEGFTKACEAVGTDVVNAWMIAVEGNHVGVHKIVGVDELKTTGTWSDDPDGSTFFDPFEEDLEDTEAAVAEYGAWADDDEFHAGIFSDLADSQFASEFTAPVDFGGVGWCLGRDGAGYGDTIDGT